MTILQLLVYSCVTTNGLDGEPLPKVCQWEPHDIYRTNRKCQEAGAHHMMSQTFSGGRGVEKHRCIRVRVN